MPWFYRARNKKYDHILPRPAQPQKNPFLRTFTMDIVTPLFAKTIFSEK